MLVFLYVLIIEFLIKNLILFDILVKYSLYINFELMNLIFILILLNLSYADIMSILFLRFITRIRLLSIPTHEFHTPYITVFITLVLYTTFIVIILVNSIFEF